MVCLTSSSQASDSKFRLGIQGTHFLSGLSGIVSLSDSWGVGGVIDFSAEAVAFRVVNRFHERAYWNAYGEGTVALWKDNGPRSWKLWRDQYPDSYNRHVGAGVGLGLEYDWRGLSPSLPPLGWNIEVGVNVIPEVDLALGVGVHWKF